jgi:acetate kinase
MPGTILLTFNPGSSSIKLGLYRIRRGVPKRLGRGEIDLRHAPLTLHLLEGRRVADIPIAAPLDDDLHGVIDEVLGWLVHHFEIEGIAVVGHRVVHGGDLFSGPTRVTPHTLEQMASLIPLAPLHQPYSVRLMRAILTTRPDLPQIASFDTAFHRTQSDIVRRYAIPRDLFDKGLKRYGFHGLSYRSIATAFARAEPRLAAGKVIVAHLGSGASLCALEAGVSRDTTMGFSTLDGVPMATRPGALDSGVLLYLMAQMGLGAAELEDLLYHRSGLLGLSGISADSRALVASSDPHAAEALAIFALRIAGAVASLATTLGGLDAIVFTAGIGEHQPSIRAGIADHLRWLGIELDPKANTAGAMRISSPASRVPVFMMATDEEQIIADEAITVHYGSARST